MKKILFSVAILAVAASCSKNEVTEIAPSMQSTIGFSTLNDRVVSKAANDGDDAFRVFAQRSSETTWFIDDYVTYTGATSAMAPVGGPYYWPTDGSAMTFYAYAPYSEDADGVANGNVVETDAATDAITLTYTVPEDAQEDFTVATPVLYAGYDITAETVESTYPTDGEVDFTFAHMLSKVTVNVVLAEAFAANYYISDGTEEEVEGSIEDANEGSSSVMSKVDEEETEDEVVEVADTPFTATFVPAMYDMVVANGLAGEYTSSVASNALANASYAGYTSYYIAPQNFADCTLQINGITIRDIKTNSALFDGQNTDMAVLTLTGNELTQNTENPVTTDKFESGKHYIFTVTIDGSATTADGTQILEVTFTAECDVDWGTDNEGALTQK